jgi:flagellar hook-associated protein 2
MSYISTATNTSTSTTVDPNTINRISGLASGMDIDKIVSNLMTAARIPLDSLNQSKQIWEWKQDDYRSTNTSLSTLQRTVFNLKLQGTFLVAKADSSSSAVTASATSSALNSSHMVEVDSLATTAVMASNAALTTYGAYTGPLASMLNGPTPSPPSLTPGADGKYTVLIGDGTSSQQFTIDPTTQSVNDLINQINSSTLNLKASWDDSLKRFYLTSTKLGQANGVSYTDESGNLMATLMGSGNSHQEAYGTSAQVKIDGISYSIDSNQVTVNNVTYTLKGTTTSPANITVGTDFDAVVNTIKDFISKYNDTLTAVNGELNEQRYPDYKPLTDSQMSTGKLTSTQIDQWTAKAKSGLLQGDDTLTSAVYNLRNAMSSVVTGLTGQVTVNNGSQQVSAAANQMSVIGITTGTWQDEGKLNLDENKLRQALQSNPQAVMDLFTKSTDASGSQITDSSQQGLAVRLYNSLHNSMDQITNEAGSASNLYDNSYISQTTRDLNKQISDLNTSLTALETRYYNEFDAMETAISQLNSQSSWLSSQFSSSSSSGQ